MTTLPADISLRDLRAAVTVMVVLIIRGRPGAAWAALALGVTAFFGVGLAAGTDASWLVARARTGPVVEGSHEVRAPTPAVVADARLNAAEPPRESFPAPPWTVEAPPPATRVSLPSAPVI